MTLLGKIFTVMILVLSVIFMTLAIALYNTYQNWHDQAEILSEQLTQEKERFEEQDRRFNDLKYQLTRHQAARRNAIANLESHLQGLRENLQKAEQENNVLISAQRDAIAVVDTTATHLKRLKDEVDKLRIDIRDVQQDRDDKLIAAVTKTDALNQSKGLERQLKVRLTQLSGDLARAKLVLDRSGLNIDTPAGGPPTLDGKVLAVSQNNLVEISLGSDDGLQEGHQLHISRGNRFLGRIIIVSTKSDKSVGEIVKPYTKGRIQKGDRVYTKV